MSTRRILNLYKKSLSLPKSQQRDAKNWYKEANRLALRLASDYGISVSKAAVAILKKAGYFNVKDFCLQDIIDTGTKYGVKLTQKQAREIADYMETKGSNAEVGINWDSITAAIAHMGYELNYELQPEEN